MKTLRKVLCLVLCLSMVLSLGIFNVSAAKDNVTDFKDAEKVGEAYEEAFDVMIGAGIINGMSTTELELEPEGTYTRAQAAKIITYMKIGAAPAEALPVPESDPFDDVLKTSWCAKYVAYCQAEGIINGYGDGRFGPSDSLTGYQWAAMLLRAVGYDENDEYTGTDWAINVAKDAIPLELFKGDISGASNEKLTRQQAVLYAFNTFTAIPLVSFSTLAGTYVHDNWNEQGRAGNTGIGATTLTGTTLAWSIYRLQEFNGDLRYGRVVNADLTGEYFYVAAGVDVIAKDETIDNAGRYGRIWAVYNEEYTKIQAISGFHIRDNILATSVNGTPIANLVDKTNSAYVGFELNNNVYSETITTGAAGPQVRYVNDGVSYYVDDIYGSEFYGANAGAVANVAPTIDNVIMNVAGRTFVPKGTLIRLIDTYPYDNLIDKIIVQTERSYVQTDALSSVNGRTVVPGVEYTNLANASANRTAAPAQANFSTYNLLNGLAGQPDVVIDNNNAPGRGDVVNVRTRIDGKVYVTKAEGVTGVLKMIHKDQNLDTSYELVDVAGYLEDSNNEIRAERLGKVIASTTITNAYTGDKGTYFKGTEGYVVAYEGPVHGWENIAVVLGVQHVREYGESTYKAKLLKSDNTTIELAINTITYAAITNADPNAADNSTWTASPKLTTLTQSQAQDYLNYLENDPTTQGDNGQTYNLSSYTGSAVVQYKDNGDIKVLGYWGRANNAVIADSVMGVWSYSKGDTTLTKLSGENYSAFSTTTTKRYNSTITDYVVDSKTIFYHIKDGAVKDVKVGRENIPAFEAAGNTVIVVPYVVEQKDVFNKTLNDVGTAATPDYNAYTNAKASVQIRQAVKADTNYRQVAKVIIVIGDLKTVKATSYYGVISDIYKDNAGKQVSIDFITASNTNKERVVVSNASSYLRDDDDTYEFDNYSIIEFTRTGDGTINIERVVKASDLGHIERNTSDADYYARDPKGVYTATNARGIWLDKAGKNYYPIAINYTRGWTDENPDIGYNAAAFIVTDGNTATEIYYVASTIDPTTATVADLQTRLDDRNAEAVTVWPGDLSTTANLTVPAGKTLVVAADYSNTGTTTVNGELVVIGNYQANGTTDVYGTLTAPDVTANNNITVYGGGKLVVSSPNTLKIANGYTISGAGTLSIAALPVLTDGSYSSAALAAIQTKGLEFSQDIAFGKATSDTYTIASDVKTLTFKGNVDIYGTVSTDATSITVDKGLTLQANAILNANSATSVKADSMTLKSGSTLNASNATFTVPVANRTVASDSTYTVSSDTAFLTVTG